VIRQLYLIFKEAVNNAARHSHCTEARAEVNVAAGRLTILVIDNGVGYKPTSEPGHHGVQSLQSRAQSLNGTIEWRSGGGTTVELNVPLPK
jgi:signal transduction histidine kinase